VEVSRYATNGPLPGVKEMATGEVSCEPKALRQHVRALFHMGPFSPIWHTDEISGDRGHTLRAQGYIQGVWAGQGYQVLKRNYTHEADIKDYLGTYAGSQNTVHVESHHTLLWVECIPEHKPEEKLDSIIIGTYFDCHNEIQCADHQYSGVAALLELSRLFKAQPPRANVTLVIWPNGEGLRKTPARGSFQFVKEFKAFDPPPAAAFALQSVGRFYDQDGTQDVPVLAKMFLGGYSKGNFISAFSTLENKGFLERFGKCFSQTSHFPLEQIAAPPLLGGKDVLESDIGPFVEKGIPGVLISDTSYFRHLPGVSDQSVYKPDELTYEAFAAFVNALHQTFVHWDGPK